MNAVESASEAVKQSILAVSELESRKANILESEPDPTELGAVNARLEFAKAELSRREAALERAEAEAIAEQRAIAERNLARLATRVTKASLERRLAAIVKRSEDARAELDWCLEAAGELASEYVAECREAHALATELELESPVELVESPERLCKWSVLGDLGRLFRRPGESTAHEPLHEKILREASQRVNPMILVRGSWPA